MSVLSSRRLFPSNLTINTRQAIFAAAAAVAFSASGAMAQNLLVNGSFENPLGSEWTRSGNVGRNSGAGLPFNTSDGSFAMNWNGGDTTPNGVLQQTFSTVPGTLYTLSFDFGKWEPAGATGGSASLRVLVISGASTVLDQTVLASTGAAVNWWQSYSFVFTATEASTVLRFSDESIGTSSFDGLLDNVSVIPSPSAAGLLGLAGLMASRRRR